jgi:DNA-directed RNA polymerase specialized sigma24 family protein
MSAEAGCSGHEPVTRSMATPMEQQRNQYDVLHPYATTTIRVHARCLAREQVIPGMAAEDYEQELAADLWRRLPTYDPERASLPTFIDRLVRNRVAGFFAAAHAAKRQHERQLVAFDESKDDAERAGSVKTSSWVAASNLADEVGLRHDVRRFKSSLPSALQRCCAILMNGSITEAISKYGLHPSSYYDGLGRLRRRARGAGLDAYLG